MRNPQLILALLAVTFLLSGCQVWQPGGTPVTGKDNAFTVTPPSGWLYATSVGPDLLASKDGLVLQSLALTHVDLTKPLPNSKRQLAATLAPYEVAEAALDDLRGNHDLLGFELRENTPATVGGRPGFKLVYSYRTKDKLHLQVVRYGAISGHRLWYATYTAPARHYFERDLPDFDATVRSLRLL
jgi:hypothetical protein